MAKQKGIFKVKGTLDDVTFYKSGQDGYLVRTKGGVPAARIASDPAFQRTRENNAEFARAGKASKMLRSALRGVMINSKDSRVTSRLTQDMMRVIKADAVNERGMRNVIDGEAELLTGFEFNINGKLSTTLFAPYVPTINRVSGELDVTLAPFVPVNMIIAPTGATHFKIVSAGAEIDFEAETYVMQNSSSAVLPIDATPTAAITQTNAVTTNSTKPLFLAVGLEFFQQVNNQMYPLKNGAFNPLSLVMVSGLPTP
ncbi:hypothetical protein [Flavobacterium sp.]|uniref:hypothetical protein n=1 Tax=Flavobacterium sp. TaxID=239 RepID=UPI0039E2BD67